jgi:hypothetical protein
MRPMKNSLLQLKPAGLETLRTTAPWTDSLFRHEISGVSTMLTPEAIVLTWLRFIDNRDWYAARRLARDDLLFRGPIDMFTTADEYIESLKRLSAIVTDVVPEEVVVQGNEVAVFYKLKTAVAIASVAEWYSIDGDKIAAVRAYFDARPFAAASRMGNYH